MNKIEFTRNLVKGKIAETVFSQMLRETGEFTVIDFGYEKIIPELIQQGYTDDNETLKMLKSAPDFAVINRQTKEVSLIEVKYLNILDDTYVFNYAVRMYKSWSPSFLFVASSDGFYFDEAIRIIENKGQIPPLSQSRIKISDELQTQYLEILNDFEKGNS